MVDLTRCRKTAQLSRDFATVWRIEVSATMEVPQRLPDCAQGAQLGDLAPGSLICATRAHQRCRHRGPSKSSISPDIQLVAGIRTAQAIEARHAVDFGLRLHAGLMRRFFTTGGKLARFKPPSRCGGPRDESFCHSPYWSLSRDIY